MSTFRVRPLREDLPFGACVQGLTVPMLHDEGVRRELRALFRDRGLVHFEDVEPSNRTQLAISRVFGPIKLYAATTQGLANPAELGVAELAEEPESAPVVEIDGERLIGWMPWHFDQCYAAKPNRARVLRCLNAPPVGGLTGFLDGVELYQSISPDLRARIELVSIRYTLDMSLTNLRFGVPDRFRVIRANSGDHRGPHDGPLPGAVHPAVRTCTEGRKMLHVSPWMAAGIDGQDNARGRRLLEAVSQELSRLAQSIAYFHQWRPTDMLLWDNLRMVHSVSGCDPAFRRVMYRTTIEDEEEIA